MAQRLLFISRTKILHLNLLVRMVCKDGKRFYCKPWKWLGFIGVKIAILINIGVGWTETNSVECLALRKGDERCFGHDWTGILAGLLSAFLWLLIFWFFGRIPHVKQGLGSRNLALHVRRDFLHPPLVWLLIWAPLVENDRRHSGKRQQRHRVEVILGLDLNGVLVQVQLVLLNKGRRFWRAIDQDSQLKFR